MKKNRLFSLINNILIIFLLLWLGIIALVNGDLFASSLSIIVGVTLLVIGALTVFGGFITSSFILGSGFKIISGLLTISIGIYFLVNQNSSLLLITTALGLYFLINGIVKFVKSFDLKILKVRTWYLETILGLIYIILGVVLLIFSNSAANVIRILIGIFLLLAAIINIIDIINSIVRSNRDEKVINVIKKHVDDADHIDIDFTK